MEDTQNNEVLNNNEKEQNIEQEVTDVPEIDWHEKYLYLAADIQNLRKRHSKQISDLTLYANENICKDLLPIIDTLELELKHNYNERFDSLYNSNGIGSHGIGVMKEIKNTITPMKNNEIIDRRIIK